MQRNNARRIFIVDAASGTGIFCPLDVIVGVQSLPAGSAEYDSLSTAKKVGATEANIQVAFGTYTSNGASAITGVTRLQRMVWLSHMVIIGPNTGAAGTVTIRPFDETAVASKAIWTQPVAPAAAGADQSPRLGERIPLEFNVMNGFILEIATVARTVAIAYDIFESPQSSR